LQYGLTEQAVALGWAASRVLVIEEDLGHSASGVDPYPGFRAWFPKSGSTTAASCWIEMSRLAPRAWTRAVVAYISVEQYERNLQRTDADRSSIKTQVSDWPGKDTASRTRHDQPEVSCHPVKD